MTEIATPVLSKEGVTGVTGVQANTGADSAVTPEKKAGVTGVTPPQDHRKITTASHGAHCADMALLVLYWTTQDIICTMQCTK